DVTRTRGVAVRKFIDENDGGTSRERRVKVELLQHGAAIVNGAAREDYESLDQSLGLRTAMCLHHADDDIGTATSLFMRRLEHGIGFPHAGVGAEEDLEFPLVLPSFCFLHSSQQDIWILSFKRHRSNPRIAANVA